jgi:iron complex outermembrane receptor protein
MQYNFLRTLLAIGAFGLPLAAPALAADGDAFELGAITIVDSQGLGNLGGTSTVGSEDIRKNDRETLGKALDLVPGVSLSRVGARNEQMVYLRGFDLRQVPIFIDGIPVYVPYDGYADLGRFTTFELSRIEVAKGFSSMVYGPNTLGGAINLITRKPEREFEGEIGGGLSFTDHDGRNGERMYANLGSNQGNWYVQAGLSYLDEDFFSLSDDFSATSLEDGGRRENSYRTDKKISFKLGLTPNDSDEYVLGYQRQEGEKGNPPYAGDVLSTRRFWQWPTWDKSSVYLSSITELGAHKLKLRAYHDTYENSLFAYDDDTYSTQARASSFRSWYDDYSNGATVEDEWAVSASNRLRLAYHFKQDVHREHDAGEPWQRFEDRTQSAALEDSHALTERLTLVLGVSHDQRDGREAQSYATGTGLVDEDGGKNHSNNGQVGLFFQQHDDTQWRASVARKSRFATIKDRYSYRMGTAIPNPDLKSEHATHFEVGYQHALSSGWQLDAALFRSHIDDLLQSVRIADSACSSSPCSQMQNVDQARVNGFELALDGDLGVWDLAFNYLYLDRQNRSDDRLRLTDTPRHKAFASIGRDIGAWQLQASVDAASRRYNSTDGAQVANGFAVFDAKVGYRFAAGLSLAASLLNLFDRDYEYSEGYPEPGRTYLLQANLAF